MANSASAWAPHQQRTGFFPVALFREYLGLRERFLRQLQVQGRARRTFDAHRLGGMNGR
jgi:hypothetical protein